MRVRKTFPADTTGWLPGFEIELDVGTVALTPMAEAINDAYPPAPIEPEQAAEPVALGFQIDASVPLGGVSAKEMARRNIAAIRMLREIEAEGRPATEAEKRILVLYAGWGGVADIFVNRWGDPDNWKPLYEELAGLLTEDELDSARASVNNSHYTDPLIITHLYKVLARLGFNGGRILEPSAGIGHFLGCMPSDMQARSRITAVEIDSISGRIAKLLYPGADLRIDGFEKVRLPNNYYDLAVSNVPFGDYSVSDAEYDKFKFLIHDYFFAKALDKVRPGGMVAFITSIGTLDKHRSALRAHLSQRAELVGALRLPKCAFKGMARTEVVTDAIFLRKLHPGEIASDTSWLNVETTKIGEGFHANAVAMNHYFISRPEMVLGEMRYRYNPRGHNLEVVLPEGETLESRLAGAVEQFPAGAYVPVNDATSDEQADANSAILAPDYVKPNAFVVQNGVLYVRASDALIPVTGLKAATEERVRGLIVVRDAIRAVLAAQIDGTEDDAVETLRADLNTAYDAFVAKNGPISDKTNRRAFFGDPDLPLLLSLENYDEETKTATKAEVFSVRTVNVPRRIESAANPGEALIYSLNERGRVDLGYMARLLGGSALELAEELAGESLIFRNPESRRWETAEEYLSGNVREKLLAAEAAAELEPAYAPNVAALREVQPADIPAAEIDARLGASWIPPSDIEAFMAYLLEDKNARVRFSALVGAWSVDSNGWGHQFAINNTQSYGTAYAPATKLLEDALNMRLTTIYFEDDDGKRHVDVVETAAAREKQERIKNAFRTWLWEDDARRHRLVRLYNDQFNNIRVRHYDGSRLVLPGINAIITLNPHQKDAIWRGIVGGNLLLAHAVGAGKTMVMCAIAMEQRRLGLARKPLIAVPNHMLEQFSREFLALYPMANILVASKDDFEGDKRKLLVSRIATGDWDAVIVTHSTFEKIPMSAEAIEQQIGWEIAELEAAILMESSGDGSRKLVKQLESAKKRLRARLEKMVKASKKDGVVTFEELGVDSLLVDEAHLFKNLFYVTKMTRVAGLPNSNSQRAFDMYLKCQYISRQANYKRGVVFATATPISNSMAEMFTMQRYLQSLMLESRGVASFDSWAANFGETVTALEIAPDGSGYRLNTRFARFCNLPELMQMFRSVADIRMAEDLDLPVPTIEGGRPSAVVAQPSTLLSAYVEELVERAEALKRGGVDPRDDNMLKITNDGRKAALDMRLIDPCFADDENSKANKAVDNIVRIYTEYAEQRATQLVFCDLSTPTKDGTFSVYNDCREKLVRRGIPLAEIAFIHDYETDAQKASLFRAVRDGKVRVLFGSTAKMGIGTNVQTRLRAIHHLDSPWRPADIEQRDGRGQRQGNMFEEIAIYRYITERSFDAFMWQTLESKIRFIRQVMKGDSALRTMEDADGTSLSYAEIKALASGNPMVMEKYGIDADVAKYSLLKTAYLDNLYRLKDEIASIPPVLDMLRKRIDRVGADMAAVQDVSGDKFSIRLQGRVLKDRSTALAELADMIRRARKHSKLDGRNRREYVGEFAGLKLAIDTTAGGKHAPEVVLVGEHHYAITADRNTVGTIIQVLEYRAANLAGVREAMQKDVAHKESRLEVLRREAERPFEYEERLQHLVARQAEINDLLDLNKDQGPIMDETEEEELVAA